MEIVFLGTGGGRVNLIKQLRWTGGFRINSNSANIHVDPGPGALIHGIELHQDPMKLDAIIVTHYHVDHYNDASLLIEAMTGYALKQKGVFIGSGYLFEDDKGDRPISKYHLSKPKEVYIGKPGVRRKFETSKGFFEIEFCPTKHDDPTGFGFKLHIDGKTIGYTSDTELTDKVAASYSGCDYLIINCLKPTKDGIPDHLETSDVIKIVSVSKPKLAILSHMGLKMLRAGPESEARKIEDATGIRTVAAKDGQIFGKGLESFL
ncbi:MAG: MBL fold metallo-hydrolase [Candidatus Micrarchaeia archaeon]|jgi:ribonuclease BN (tRNA processing enzyme)